MGIRDLATDWYLQLHTVMSKLNNLEDCEDPSEMIELARESSADIHSVLESIDSELELDMQEEFSL